MRLHRQKTPEDWDQFLARQPRAHVLQGSAWGELKRAYGWDVERVMLADEAGIVAGAQILFRPLPFRLGTMAYIAMGPYGARDQHPALWAEIDRCARQHGAAFLKWEPGICRDEPAPDFASLGFRQSPQTVQPPRTVMLDIGDDDEAIQARMNQGTRRKIRQSQKKSIHYYHGARTDVDTFNAMIQTTGARNAFGVHEPGYYELAYDLFVSKGDAVLIMAEHEDDPLAGIMVFAAGDTAWYLYGASSSVKRNLMATYGTQWQAIQWAKARGCQYYDLWGVPDEDKDTLEAHFQERSDGLWGVYGFKRGWGGEVIRSLGAWDKVYNPVIYAAYRLALKFPG